MIAPMRRTACMLATFASIVAVSADAAENRLIGTWEIVESVPAPWSDTAERAKLDARGHRLHKLQVTFGGHDVRARHGALGCKKVRYRAAGYARDALFQGSLPEPALRITQMMGFTGEDIPSVDVNCTTGLFTYHFRDRDTVLFALDNVIYTMKRH
ncbi:MAG: hypothetical protein HY056_01745 [Proteobacteria bacterium]|nr:hypothetical protein [Pseudomonadota bacterium]